MKSLVQSHTADRRPGVDFTPEQVIPIALLYMSLNIIVQSSRHNFHAPESVLRDVPIVYPTKAH